MMRCSEQTNEISAALAKAQGTINNPGKGALNPHFKNKYADLSAGINAIREGLSVNGIAVIQSSRMEGEVMMLDTRLTHASGQWFECEWPVAKFPSAPQVIGSALTYARRYSLFSMAGIAGEDDDANAANGTPVPAPADKVGPDEVAHLGVLLRDTESDQGLFLKALGVKGAEKMSPTERNAAMYALTMDQYKTALALFERKKKQAEAAQ